MDFWKDIWHALNTPLSSAIVGGVVLLIATALKITPLGLFFILLLWIFLLVELYCPQVRNSRSKLLVNVAIFVLLTLLSILLIVSGHAVNPDESAATPASTEAPSPTSSMQPVEKATESNETGSSTGTVETTKDQKFRVGPIVRLRPLNSEINKSADGIIEVFMNNPNLNDVTLEVDIVVDVPSDIYIYARRRYVRGSRFCKRAFHCTTRIIKNIYLTY